MKKIAIEFTYHVDMIVVPDDVAENIKKIQRRFDKWLYDKSINHGCWIIKNGKKMGVSFDTSDFVNYINTYILNNNVLKARIIQTNLKIAPDNIPVLFF